MRSVIVFTGAQSDLFKPKPETVALSATEKYEMKKWGIDVDAILWPDGTSPPAWLKVGKALPPTNVKTSAAPATRCEGFMETAAVIYSHTLRTIRSF